MLEACGVEVSYAGAVRALRGVTADVGPGQVVAVLGGNGAGKSTLLRAICGSLPMHGGKVTAGTIRFAGHDLVGRSAAEVVGLGVVHVPEGRRIFGRLTVEENLRAGGLSVRSRRERLRARERVYELFPVLAERRDQRAVLLSGGEQQMLAIGRGLMSSPRLLLLDEPSLGLAPRVVSQIAEVIRQINAMGVAVVLVEQNAAMALGVADHGYVLELGRIVTWGPAAELAASDEIVRSYLAVGAGQAATAPPAAPGAAGPGEGAPVARAVPPAGRTLARWQPPPRRRRWPLGRGGSPPPAESPDSGSAPVPPATAGARMGVGERG
ncbi:MAG: ABC transporter ATP-binding protein [Frankia sp.]|nr:ABC transporter ATP-binding protein [Frankia sp.]